MIRHIAVALGVALLAGGCASRTESADTAATLAVDTLKPDSDASETAESTAADTVDSTKAASPTTTKTTPTKTATKQGETKELGRDSIIRFDTKDKRRQLPPADSAKRP
jgi:hypothetical protein